MSAMLSSLTFVKVAFHMRCFIIIAHSRRFVAGRSKQDILPQMLGPGTSPWLAREFPRLNAAVMFTTTEPTQG